MQIKRLSFKIFRMSLRGNDTYKTRLVKIFYAKPNCFKNIKKTYTKKDIILKKN